MDIPVLDWNRFTSGDDAEGFAADLGEACRETGFFVLTGHGISKDLIADVFTVADRFFALPPEEKAEIAISKNPHNRGWAQQGSEALDEASGLKDRKEAFNVGLDLPVDDPRVIAGEPFRGVNVWPDLDGFRSIMLDYYECALDLGRGLHRAFEADLGLPQDYFEPHFTEPMATLRVLSYPAAPDGEGIGAGAHTDYGSVTLLMTDGVAGLQVKPRGGDWMDVPHIKGAFVVNIGDCLMRWSNDLYVSTPHRVLPPKTARRSIAFFLDPNPESIITALPGTGAAKYAPITGADYLRSRLDATYTPEPTQ
ncbi:2-oxoglutarate and iron-dependent oxygenase domain-containing protein [Octadecabacter sp. 1_MG-2023]|uniref:isopenicillin N synthase family dioxygenase n=1 Tax=unclassified Octadecabacter TaxID=196158 RepID=UPI001C0A2BA3|nr:MULTISPECIES: 2-oxoglutarate and iron-dependent oxygenase domain-containing protein [unclassified Octadecabacter]MBU2994609.1 isopenicillin N synthase family oxygenase [Octadecabacter sp. B2R22]MDO6734098.1 2-oxoglutarate and iron-dependent oxygenase domain-containing protein [Octadecabacter sp. 1_MG-2023]